jgi:hypothetical protein
MTHKYPVQVTLRPEGARRDPEFIRLAIAVSVGNTLADCTSGVAPIFTGIREEKPCASPATSGPSVGP